MQYKLAIIGTEGSTMLYRALGVEASPAYTPEEGRAALEALASQHHGDEEETPLYAVVFVEEDLYEQLPADLIEKFAKRSLPAVVPVPSPSSSAGKSFASNRLGQIVERAIGTNILG
jgi:vacuolar-type H+-ATPase subunit F/Vma7